MAATAAVASSIAASATSAALAAGTALGFEAGTTFAAMAVFQNVAVSLTMTAAARALMPSPGMPGGSRGTKVQLAFGEDAPQSVILGKALTAGDLVYHGSWGKAGGSPNAYYVQVFELADWPARLDRCFINGEWVELLSTPHPDGLGFPVQGYQRKGKDYLWVKYYDGTQTVADPYLVDTFGGDPDYPWLDDMIGRGIPYVIVTALLQPKLNYSRPECRFQVSAWGHYDPRRDSTAGGEGAQRFDDWSTWAPTNNPIVLIYNIFRGLRDPITGDFAWGGQGIGSWDLPASIWFAAMNECELRVAIPAGGTEPQYLAGIEARLDDQPASVIEELLKACQGQVAEVAGEWHVRAGAPGVPVYAFGDDDVIVTDVETFDPYPGLDEAYNAVQAVYPEPAEGWNSKDAPERADIGYLAADGGKRNVASVQLPAVYRKRQVQRLQLSMLNDSRRFRRHTTPLPPEARKLGPLDVVARTSSAYGYIDKSFDLGMVEDLANGCVATAQREVDPNDYDWSADLELPAPVNDPRRPVRPVEYADFSVEGATIVDAGGSERRPAIRLNWTVRDGVDAIYYRVRLAADADHVPGNAPAAPPPGGSSTSTLTIGGEPVEIGGEELTYTVFEDETAGTLLIHPVLPATEYEVQAIYAPTVGREWSAWLPVTTPDVRIGEDDLTDLVVGKIEEARTLALDNALAVDAMLARSDEIEDLLTALNEDAFENLAELADAIAGGDFATLEARVGAGLQRGWVADPTFARWTGSSLDEWTGTGLATYGAQAAGRFPTALLIDVPTGSAAVDVTASSETAGQMDGADYAAPYVMVTLHLCALSGSLSGAYCRAEWKAGGVWLRGDALGQVASLGRLSEDWGFVIDDDRIQEKAVIFKAVPGASAIRLVFAAKQATPTSAAELRVDYLDVRAASEAERDGFLANGYADAAIAAYDLTITGPGGAIAAAISAVTAAFGAADAGITSTVVALATDTEALAGRIDLIDAQFGGNNLVVNGTFRDGVRAGGDAPSYWSSWDAEASVIQRGSTADPAVVNAPTRYVARVAGDTVVRDFLAITSPLPVVPGQRISTGIQVSAIGTAPSFQLGVRLRFYDTSNALMTNRVVNHPITVNGSAWLAGSWDDVVPPGAATFDLLVRRAAGGSGHVGLFTNVEARLVDGVSYAAAQQATVAAADANLAIATMQSQVGASFADFSAFVSTVATAAATSDLAASMYVIRATAGAGSAGMRIVAFDDETGAGGSITLFGDHVIVPGTLSASALVISDLGVNKVPDDQIQSSRAWSGTGFTVIPDASNANAGSIGEFRWSPGAGLPATGASVAFQVRGGQRLNCGWEAQRLGGTTMACRAQIQWLDRAGGVIGSSAIGADISSSGTSILSRQAQVTAPAAARKARFLFVVLAGTNGAVRFTAPEAIPNMDASVLITPDGAFFEQLAAQTAWIYDANIVNAAVSTLKIGSNAVTIPLFVQKNTAGPTATTSFTDILDFNMTLDFPGTLTVMAAVNFEGVDGSFSFTSYRSDWQMIIDGSVVFDTDLFRSPAMDNANDVITMVGAKFCAAGTRRVRIQFRKPPSEPAGRLFPRNRRTSAVALVAKR